MLSHFHAAGQWAYDKSAHLYLRQMSTIQDRMTSHEYSKFCLSEYFTAWRTDKYLAGVRSDMTIEQVLMRAVKNSGGLTRGRGITDNVLQNGHWQCQCVLHCQTVFSIK